MAHNSRRSTLVGKENVKPLDAICRAKAAPDFTKLHKRWDEKLQKGKAVKKKPLTSVQPFQLSQIPNKTNVDINFKIDPKAKESILNCRGIVEGTGRATITGGRVLSRSGIPRPTKPSRLTDIPKVIATSVTGSIVEPTGSRQQLPVKSPHAKKSYPKQELNIEFHCDEHALESIINGEGIALDPASPERQSGKFGPIRKGYSTSRAIPSYKMTAKNRLSERGRVIPKKQDDNEAAKKRWSIYSRDSFSTKVDLMTWLKQLTEEPKPKINISQGDNITHSETSDTTTASITEKDIILSSNSQVSMKDDTRDSLSFSRSDCARIHSGSSQEKFSFSQSKSITSEIVVSTQRVDGRESENIAVVAVSIGGPQLDTPVIMVTPKKSPATKSILKKSALCSIKESASDCDLEQLKKKIYTLTPRTPAHLRPIRSAKKITPCKTTPCKTIPCKTAPCKTTPCKTTPCKTTPCKTTASKVAISTHCSRSANGTSLEISGTSEVSTPLQVDVQEDVTLGNIEGSPFVTKDLTPMLKMCPENSNRKKVRWKSELTYLSPIENDLKLEEADEQSPSCVVKLVVEETNLLENEVSCNSSSSPSTKCWSDILKQKPSSDITKLKSFSSVAQSVTTPIPYTANQNDYSNKRNKTKKKKRCSILDRIYGDAIVYCDDSPNNNLDANNSSLLKFPEDHTSNDRYLTQSLDNLGKVKLMNSNSSISFPSTGNAPMHQCKSGIDNMISKNILGARLSSSCSTTTLRCSDNSKVHVTENKPTEKTMTIPNSYDLLSFVHLKSETSVNQSLSELEIQDTPNVETCIQSVPSTFVTYCRNTSSILYGDIVSESVNLPSPLIPSLPTSEPKEDIRPGMIKSIVDTDDCTYKTEYVGGVSVLTPIGRKGRAYYDAFIISPKISSPQGSTRNESTLVENQNIIKKELLLDSSFSLDLIPTPEASKKSPNVSSLLPISTYLRSDRLDKYVTSLLSSSPGIPTCGNIIESKNFLPVISSKKTNLHYTDPTSRKIICTPENFDEDKNNVEDGSNTLSESEMCMVFSTPFKQGLRNHILQMNGVSNADIHNYSELLDSTSLSNGNTLPLGFSDRSAFRHVPTCNTQAESGSPVIARNESDEMQALFGIMTPTSPGRYMQGEDTEIALYHQLGEISSRFHEEVDVLRKGVQNPLSIMLSSGDEMHFVPIEEEKCS